MNRRNSEPPAFREKPESASSESHHASTSHSSSSGLSRALPGPAVVSAGIFIASGLVCDSLQAQLSADRDVLIPAFLRPSLGFLATALLSVLGPLLAARLNRTGSLDWLGNGSLTPPRKHYVALAVVLVAAQILWAIAFSSVPLYILQSLSVSHCFWCRDIRIC